VVGVAEISLREFVRHPATLASSVVGVLGGVLQLPFFLAAWDALVATSGQLFGTLSLFTFTLGPRVEWLPEDTLVTLTIVVGIVAGGARLWSWFQRFRGEIDNDT
jgi:uncharacterized metal-binding protein